MMERWRDLKQYEHRAHCYERGAERVAALHGAHERAHRDREQSRQQSAQPERGPPCDCEPAIGFQQNAEELPLGTRF
jgi:hypothetical protein